MKDKSLLYIRAIEGPWRKAQKTIDNPKDYNCVEVYKFSDGAVAIRDSNFPVLGTLRFDAAEWDAFCDGVRNNEF